MSRNILRLLAFLALLAVLANWPFHPSVAARGSAPAAEADTTATDTFKQLTLFSDVLERVRSDYVDPVTDEKMIEYALNGLLSSLDPHSGYLNKKNYEDMQTMTHGEFGGLGIEVTMENNLVKVVTPIDDTPAAKAGLQSGDLVTHLDGKQVTEMTLNEAVDKMRGVPGTKIVLTVRRGGISGQPFDVTLTRAVIQIRSVRWEPKDDIAYIRITTFNDQTQPGLDKALAEADKKIGDKLIGYVIDLRNNPGGLLDQAVSVSGSFLEAGKEVVSTRSRHKEENQSYVARGGDKTHGKPIAVLINAGSASAAEIVAGALQDHRRAVILGVKSFGKGSVQTIIPLAGAGAMRLTTSRYYTPSGRSIQALGIEPDITVQPAKLEKLAQGGGLREADLRGALTNETAKPDKNAKEDKPEAANDNAGDDEAAADKNADKANAKTGKKDEPFDYQLARAIDLLRGLHLFGNKAAPAGDPKK